MSATDETPFNIHDAMQRLRRDEMWTGMRAPGTPEASTRADSTADEIVAAFAALTSRVETLEAEKQRADELANLAGEAHAELTRAGIAEHGPIAFRVLALIADRARLTEENQRLRDAIADALVTFAYYPNHPETPDERIARAASLERLDAARAALSSPTTEPADHG